MTTINAKLIEQLDLIEPEFNETEEMCKRASNSINFDCQTEARNVQKWGF